MELHFYPQWMCRNCFSLFGLHITIHSRWPLTHGPNWQVQNGSRIQNAPLVIFQACFKRHTFSGTSLPATRVYFTGPMGCVHAELVPKDVEHISRQLPAIVMSATACRARTFSLSAYLFTFSLSLCCDSRRGKKEYLEQPLGTIIVREFVKRRQLKTTLGRQFIRSSLLY
jgi:hypothetical protein